MFNSPKIRVSSVENQSLPLLELAHELKIPLFNIKSFLETLYEYNFILSDRQRLDFLETANRETNRLIAVINNLIEIELQQNDSNLQLVKYRFQLSILLSQVVDSYKLTAKSKKIGIIYFYDKCDYIIYGNLDLITQVINNLIGNSLKYSFSHKNIFLRAKVFRSISSKLSLKKDKLNLSVLDEGVGIPRLRLTDLELNTDCFNFREANTSVKGTGLGLKIVRRIIYSHESRLSLLSLLNKGTLINFSLGFFKLSAGKGT